MPESQAHLETHAIS